MKDGRGRKPRWDFAALKRRQFLTASMEDELHFRKAASLFGRTYNCKMSVRIHIAGDGARSLRGYRL